MHTMRHFPQTNALGNLTVGVPLAHKAVKHDQKEKATKQQEGPPVWPSTSIMCAMQWGHSVHANCSVCANKVCAQDRTQHCKLIVTEFATLQTHLRFEW